MSTFQPTGKPRRSSGGTGTSRWFRISPPLNDRGYPTSAAVIPNVAILQDIPSDRTFGCLRTLPFVGLRSLRRPATAAGPKHRARRILPRLSRVCRWGPAAPNHTLRSRCARSGIGLFCLDPPAVGERASQKSSLGLLWLGAGRRVGGGWSPVTVTAQVGARSGGAALPAETAGDGQPCRSPRKPRA